jgi:murein DD-endopeptidase MepM/ murein hydrolase activator NlpD
LPLHTSMLTQDGGVECPIEEGRGPGVGPAKPASPAVAPASRGFAGTTPRRRRPGTSRRSQFSLLIVRGDGVRVLRFNFARAAAVGVSLILALAVAATGLLIGDWVQLRELTREAVTFNEQIQQQRATINTFNRRVAEIRQEMAGWRELHARIWEPLGPEIAPGGRDRGIGGGTPQADPLPPRPSPVDELNQLSASVKEQTENLKSLERLMARAGRMLAALPTRWPVRGSVNSEFGTRHSPWTQEREFHSGLDIRAGRGTPIYAPAAGTVVHAGSAQDYGTTIVLDHGQDIRSLYGHLSKLSVQPGQRVVRGTMIGYTGNTGRSSGPHLHYEILVKGQAVNPRAYLWD